MPSVTTPVMTDATGQLIAAAILASSEVPAEIEIDDDGSVTQALVANTSYLFTGDLTDLTITLTATTGIAHYHFSFDSGSTAPTLTLPQSVTMPSGFTVIANKHYEIDIYNGYGVSQKW